MGKDTEAQYHLPKGKSSGSAKKKDEGLNLPASKFIDESTVLADQYSDESDELPGTDRMRHPNRNVNKGAERNSGKHEQGNGKKINAQPINDQPVTVPEELPGVLTKILFAELADYKSALCISIFIPTHRAGVEADEQADSRLFKNALQQINNQLKKDGVDQAVIQIILDPGYDLLQDDEFWGGLNYGLAVFMAEGFFKYVKLHESPKEEVLVNTSFFLKPLVNAMTVKEYFYLLVISKKQVKLFKGDFFGMEKIEIDELPNGVDDVAHFEEKEDQKIFRSESGQGSRGANFHGQGGGKPDEKDHIASYLEEVDHTLWKEMLNRENVPVLLAGVEYLLPIYKSITHYKFIWDHVITGSHEHDDIKTLYQQARDVMKPYFDERTKKALANYGNQSATTLTSSRPEDIVAAAHYGRIAHLFIKPDEHIWGKFDEMKNELFIHHNKEVGDECLLDKSIIKTVLHGGDVHFLSEDDMPEKSIVSALLRY